MTKKKLIPLDDHLAEIKVNDPEHYQMIQEDYEKKVEKITHGGKRVNSGRKTIQNKKITLSLTVSPDLIEIIDQKRGTLSRSKFISEIIKKETA
jgi:hypothetical protein